MTSFLSFVALFFVLFAMLWQIKVALQEATNYPDDFSFSPIEIVRTMAVAGGGMVFFMTILFFAFP